jgi:methionine sulfoxide reductase catalytic subunit
MLIRRRRGWELPESQVTPETVMLDRRRVIATAGIAAGVGLFGAAADGQPAPPPAAARVVDDTAKYPPGRPVTPEKDSTSYNNFYEFSDDKDLAEAAQKLVVSPWSVSFEGLVDKPRVWPLDDLLKQVQLEERIYRHRCVEAWSMVVPWTGFPMSKLVALAGPSSGAKFVQFTTATQPATMPGLGEPWYPWPYIDSVTLDEAMNDVAFMVTGMYGKPLPKQDGAPIRIHLPWKYGFKSVKSVVKVTFTDMRPVGFWEKLQNSEYGFWANVNPEVPHPRWSQATERDLGTGNRIPTQIYNGYGAYVAGLYANMSGQRLFM